MDQEPFSPSQLKPAFLAEMDSLLRTSVRLGGPLSPSTTKRAKRGRVASPAATRTTDKDRSLDDDDHALPADLPAHEAGRKALRREKYEDVPTATMHGFNVGNALVKPELEAFFTAIDAQLPELSMHWASNRYRQQCYKRAAKALGIAGRNVGHVSRSRHGQDSVRGKDSHADIGNALWFEPAKRNRQRHSNAMTTGTIDVLFHGLADEAEAAEEVGKEDAEGADAEDVGEEEELDDVALSSEECEEGGTTSNGDAATNEAEDVPEVDDAAALQANAAKLQITPADARLARHALRAATGMDGDEDVGTAVKWVAALRTFAESAAPGEKLTTSPISKFVRMVLHHYHNRPGMAPAGCVLYAKSSDDEAQRQETKPMDIHVAAQRSNGTRPRSCLLL
jgi:hypothetical protein